MGLTACDSRLRSPDLPFLVRDSAGVQIAVNDPARVRQVCEVGRAPSVTIGTAEGAEEYQLYRVFGARKLGDGRIVLVNQGSQEVRYYDADGRFLMSAGGEGEGPGEFRDAFHLWALPGDTLWVGDYRPWQFEVFGPEGEWVRAVVPTPRYGNVPAVISLLDDGRAVLAERAILGEPGDAFETRFVTVVTHGPDGALLDTVGTYPNGRWGQVEDDPRSAWLYPLFESFARVTASGSEVYVGHGSTPEIRVLDVSDSLRVTRIIRWSVGDRAVSEADVRAERARLAERYEDVDLQTRRALVAPLVSEERPVADRFPAFTNLLVGRDGTLWVKQYPRPRSPDEATWMRFDQNGRLMCHARLPPVEEILEFGDGYLLSLDRDSLGVERVLEFPVGPPAETD